MSANKRQRQALISAVRPTGITDSALAKVLGALKANPQVLDAAGGFTQIRSDLSGHVSQYMDRVLHSADLPLIAGSTLHWEFASPSKLLKLFMQECVPFRNMFMLTAAATVARNEPLSVILYHDEFTPGQVLKPDNKRKTTCFYFTFAEFGDFIRSEYAWMPLACFRHTLTAVVSGGLSTAVKLVLRSFFFGPENFVDGAVIPLEGMGNTLVFGRMMCMIADEAAIKQTFAIKGASGLLPCLKCLNVVLQNHGILEHDADKYFVDITAPASKFALATNTDVWQKFDKLIVLKAGGCTKAKLEQMEKTLGVNLVPDGVLGDVALRQHAKPVDDTGFDPMHCFFSNGIVSQEMHLILEHCAEHLGITFKHLEDWCKAGWCTQKHTDKNSAGAVFSSRREAASKDGFKGIASELLAIYPLICYFIESVVRPRLPGIMKDAIESFATLGRAIALLNSLKRDRTKITRRTCDDLKSLLTLHLQLFQKAYGADQIRPKHHLSQHIPDQIFAHKMLIDCWPCERKHRSLKRIAGTIDNTRNFERSLLGRAIVEQVHNTPEDTFSFKLLGKQLSSPEIAVLIQADTVMVASSVRFGVVRLSVDDVIVVGDIALKIKACLKSGLDLSVLGDVYDFARKSGSGVEWKPLNSIACFTLVANTFVCPRYWTFQSNNFLLTLLDE